EQLHGQLRSCAVAGARIIQLLRIDLGTRHDVGERCERALRLCRNDVGRDCEIGDWRKILGGIVGNVLVERRIGKESTGGKEQRGPIGIGARNRDGAEIAARARAVLDDDGLLERLPERRLQDAGDHIGRSRGTERNDDPDRLAGAELGRNRRRREPGQNQDNRAGEPEEGRDECASFHSTTSLARMSREGGTVRPIAWAAFILITSSYFMGAYTGQAAAAPKADELTPSHDSPRDTGRTSYRLKSTLERGWRLIISGHCRLPPKSQHALPRPATS